MVVQWIALLPHRKKVPVLILRPGTFCVQVCEQCRDGDLSRTYTDS